ncbi:M20 metallopeptidase family protein [Desulfomarina profundi]|nr:M20 family metallopeptidase [Desulfomarina profundi]
MKKWLVSLRNDFHRHPELSMEETRTTGRICEVLKNYDVEISTFDDMTGVVGIVCGKKTEGRGRTLALRADIDALPVQEYGDRKYRSVVDGVMHACGHDANTVIMLGVVRKIHESGLIEKINGTVKFIFQPAEEKLAGAKAMIAKGVLENPHVDWIVAGHMDPNLPVGTVGVFSHIGHASSDPFELVITGRGTHGASPQKGINPISAGGYFITALETILSRCINPADSAVISIGTFHAGNAGNVIPDHAVLKGSIRTHDESVRKKLLAAVEDLVKGVDTIFGTTSKLEVKPGAPLGVNDRGVCKFLHDASVSVLSEEKVRTLPFHMGSEDFYYFTEIIPGAIMRLGCADMESGIIAPLHSPRFDIHGDVLQIGTDIFFKAVENFFDVR